MGTYLGAVDLVTQNQLTIVARIGINPSDRQLGDVSPGLATIFVSNGSTSSRSVGSLVATEFNVTTSVVDNMGGKKFSTEPLSLPVYSTPQNNGYATFNQQVGLNFGSMSLTAVDNLTSQLFDTPGSYNWTVPAGVTSISVAGIGGGGGGAQKSAGGSGGGGGLITYSNSIAVTPGTTCTIVVGSGGATGGTYGVNGSSTYLLLPGTNVPIVIAQGGAGGDSIFWLSNSIGIASYVDITGTITTQTAVDPAGGAITYSVSAGSLPTGASLNTSTGAISWVRQNISSDTEYTTFTLSATNGTQTITKPFTIKILKFILTIDYLIVGGGGGAGYDVGGGGGSGGVIVGTAFSIAPGSTVIVFTIGGGGTSAQSAVVGNNGNATTATFSGSTGAGAVVAPGGGGGGSHTGANNSPTLGQSGGSGGGGGGQYGSLGGGSSQGSYPSFNGVGYGNSGGTSFTGQWGSGSGGGAGGAGVTGTGGFVTGGDPYTSSISGSSVNYAGGGYGNSDAGGVYATGNNSSNVAQGYYGYGANGTGAPNASSYNGNPGIAIVRYLGSTQIATGGTTSTSGGYFIHTFTSSGTLTF